MAARAKDHGGKAGEPAGARAGGAAQATGGGGRYAIAGQMRQAGALAPGLYPVATPIGNLADITIRALETLAGADLILAEDTRVTRRLLAHYAIATPTRAFHEHNEARAQQEVVDRLAQGARIALVSDAGTPLISDPGFSLVRAARERGLSVTTAPGPSAAIAALSMSGLPSDRFLFAGFLPPKSAARQREIAMLKGVPATLIFYETGPRLADSLADLAELLGARDAVIAREITKMHEEVVAGTLPELRDRYQGATPKGEIVLLVGPPRAEAATEDSLDDALRAALATLPAGKAAASVAAALGLPRGQVYARALELKA